MVDVRLLEDFEHVALRAVGAKELHRALQLAVLYGAAMVPVNGVEHASRFLESLPNRREFQNHAVEVPLAARAPTEARHLPAATPPSRHAPLLPHYAASPRLAGRRPGLSLLELAQSLNHAGTRRQAAAKQVRSGQQAPSAPRPPGPVGSRRGPRLRPERARTHRRSMALFATCCCGGFPFAHPIPTKPAFSSADGGRTRRACTSANSPPVLRAMLQRGLPVRQWHEWKTRVYPIYQT